MGQRGPVYAASPSLQLLGDWMAQHLPSLAEGARRRLIQLTAGIFETQSVLVDTIATSTAFQSDAASSTATQVRRILRDTRLTLEAVSLPLVQQWLLAMQPQVIYLAMDESTHNRDYGLFEVGLATDGSILPLGWTLFAYDAARGWQCSNRA